MKKHTWLTLVSIVACVLVLVIYLRPVATGQSQSGAATIGATSGVTVLGYGDATAKADLAHVTLIFNAANTSYGPEGPKFEPADEKGVAQVAAVLAANGIATDTLTVNLFGRSSFYGGGGPTASTVEFSYAAPDKLNDFLAKIQTQLKEERGPAIQQVAAFYLPKDCQSLETKAWEQALINAKTRAEGVAKLMDVKLGDLQSIAEQASVAPYGSTPVGCAAFETAQHATDLSSFVINRLNSAAKVEISICTSTRIKPRKSARMPT